MTSRAVLTDRMTAWDEKCGPVIPLTVRRGPSAGRTFVYCTCGWEHVYKTRKKAARRSREHLALANRFANRLAHTVPLDGGAA